WTMRGMSMRAAGGGRLTGVDAVINAVGILREGRGRRFDAIHDQAPGALRRLPRGGRAPRPVSALGPDAGAASRFHLSKRAADDYLGTLNLEWVIVQPAFVYGLDVEPPRRRARRRPRRPYRALGRPA
ncbi:MAG: hypothetical protein M3461_01230, partial [Pseudomonadota bacterium]|nr:hypothetical protein [Pseudomonadota bacterium]